jgi:hypothetical protein
MYLLDVTSATGSIVRAPLRQATAS